MEALFNNHMIADEITMKISDRAFQFGDGLFETIAVVNQKPLFLTYHLERLQKGAQILKLTLPDSILTNAAGQIATVINANKVTDASIKVMVWRKPSAGKGFDNSTSQCNFLIICRLAPVSISILNNVSFAEHIYFQYSTLSSIKTLNALPYILAANEKISKGLDEIIVLNDKGFVCECPSSNIFWITNGTYYTPPITSGCLDGVTRRVIIERLNQAGISFKEALITKEELLEASTIFTTNSSGIKYIARIDNTSFDTTRIELLNGIFN